MAKPATRKPATRKPAAKKAAAKRTGRNPAAPKTSAEKRAELQAQGGKPHTAAELAAQSEAATKGDAAAPAPAADPEDPAVISAAAAHQQTVEAEVQERNAAARPDPEPDPEPESEAAPTRARPKSKASVGQIVNFFSTVRRAGIRNADGVPAIVTGIDEAGGVSLTVFEPKRTRYVDRVTDDSNRDEYWGKLGG